MGISFAVRPTGVITMDNPEHLLAHTLPFWPELSAEEQDTLKRSLLSAAVPKGTVTHRADQECQGLLLLLVLRAGDGICAVEAEVGQKIVCHEFYLIIQNQIIYEIIISDII